MNRFLVLVLSISLALTSIACGPPWTVVKQASPNPMTPTNQFFVEPLSFDGLRVGGSDEASWQANKDAEAKANWQGDKQGMIDQFSAGFDSHRDSVARAPQAPGDFQIKPHVTWIEPGFNALVASHPTEVKLDVQVLDSKGQLVNQFTVDTSIKASISNVALGTRLRDAATYLGGVTAKYVKTRLGGA